MQELKRPREGNPWGGFSKTLSGRHFYSDAWNWSNSRKLVQPNQWLEHWHVQNAICQIQILSIATKNPFDSLWDSCHPRIVFCETFFWFTFRVWQRAVTSKSFGCGRKKIGFFWGPRYSKFIGTPQKKVSHFLTLGVQSLPPSSASKLKIGWFGKSSVPTSPFTKSTSLALAATWPHLPSPKKAPPKSFPPH